VFQSSSFLLHSESEQGLPEIEKFSIQIPE
jgi:hypothetical protein